MSQVLLREYLDEMRSRLREGKYGDVFALGQHVLRYYPKHLETYRLLAQASLETDDLTAAADLFHRVRSADPENIFAFVGLSIVHELRNELQEAIWHLERAFELQPANEELRTELLRLYAAFEGAPRTRLKLTSGGLARLYARQGLYAQAIQEFRSVLRRDPTRVDAQVALAEVFYRVGRKQEAAELAQALLDQLPFCLKANLLLGALWSENGVPEAETLLRRARSLDPEHTVARGLVPDHWDDAPPPQLPAMSEEAAAAAQRASASLPKSKEGTGRDIDIFESLAALEEPSGESESAPATRTETEASSMSELPLAAEVGVAPETESPSAPGSVEQVPTTRSEGASEGGPTAPAAVQPPVAFKIIGEQTPPRLRQPSLPKIGPTIPGAIEKLPVWLRHGAAAAAAGQAPVVAPQVPPKTELSAPERQGWLARARQAARSGELEDAQAHNASISPLEEETASLAGTATGSPRPIEDEAAVPEWLRSGSTTTPPTTTGAEGKVQLPDWVAHSASESQEQVPSGASSTDQLSAPEQQVEPVATEASVSVSVEAEPSEVEMPPEAQVPDTALPDWLQTESAGEQPFPASTQTQAPDGLASPSPEVENMPGTETPLGPSGSEGDDTIPDWLREISGEVEAAPIVSDTIQSKAREPFDAGAVTPVATKAEPGAEISVEPGAETGKVPAPSEQEGAGVGAPTGGPATEAQAVGKPDFEPETLLAEARALRASGNMTGAVDLYARILQRGPSSTAAVIADLEAFAQEAGALLPVHRLLGDAYAQVGRFQEALEQYRTVLDK